MKQFYLVYFLLSITILNINTAALSVSEPNITMDNVDFNEDPKRYCTAWFKLQDSEYKTNLQVRTHYISKCENWRIQELKNITTQTTFEELTGQKTFQLKGDYGTAEINFGRPRDFIITNAVLELSYSYSPALLALKSHVKVYLNGEVISILNVSPTEAGKSLRQKIKINPLSISDYNNIKFELIGHDGDICSDPSSSFIWFDISSHSSITITKRHLKYKNDLINFPEPFYDERDFGLLNLPFVFAEKPSKETIRSAGVLASWFGAQSQWRGSRFPTLFNKLTTRHSIVFATNDERPDFLAEYPLVEKPTLAMVSHPIYRTVKILLILGKNHEQLEQAMQGLVLGKQLLSGQAISIDKIEKPNLRKPYDAPNWVRTDRPMKLIELVDNKDNLQVKGYLPAAIRINMRVPADLFTWRSRGIAIDLKYRYTPMQNDDNSRLNISINEQFIESFNLLETGHGGRKDRVRVPLLGSSLFGAGSQLYIPAFQVGANNQMQFNFSFTKHKKGECDSIPPFNVVAAIDPDSVIDFSGFPHYAVMPNLGYFANAGYPYTRMADLSETVVIIPENSDSFTLEAFFNLMSRMGVSTGYPSLAYQLAYPLDNTKLQDRDIIVIGDLPTTLKQELDNPLPQYIEASKRSLLTPPTPALASVDTAGYNAEPDQNIDVNVQIISDGDIASLVGFESPFSDARSVVLLMANKTKNLLNITKSLYHANTVSNIFGNVVIFREEKINSNRVGKTYYVGELSAYNWLWYHLSSNPVLLAFSVMFAIIVISLALWKILRNYSKQRLKDGLD